MSAEYRESPDSGGLRPMIPFACRRALMGMRFDGLAGEDLVTREHVTGCAFCAARVRAASSIASFASQRSEAPQELSAGALLDSIYERATEHAEQGVLGQWVEQADVAPVGDAGVGSWEDAIARSQPELDSVAEFVKAPAPPLPEIWSGVRRSILAGVVSDRAKLRTPRHWRVMLAGAAAIMVIGLVAISVDGLIGGPTGAMPNKQNPAQPVIVFADLDRAPDVEFAIVRYGRRR